MPRCICNFIPSLIRFEINKQIRRIIKHELDPDDLIDRIINGIITEEQYIDPDDEFFRKKNTLPFIYILNPFIINMQREDGLRLVDSVDDNRKVDAINDIHFDDYLVNKAREKFTKQPPTCYLIMGKPGLQEFELGEKIAEIYKCVHINVNQLVTNEIDNKTKLGKWLQLNLALHRKIPTDIILLLIQREMDLEIIQYHGYVLSGFPIVPDYQLSNSYKPFTYSTFKYFDLLIDEMLQEVINYITLLAPLENEILEDLKEPMVDELESQEPAAISFNQQKHLFNELKSDNEVFLNEKDINDSIREQMTFLLNLKLRPNIVIYLICPDTDLLLMRTSKIKLTDPDYEEKISETIPETEIVFETGKNTSSDGDSNYVHEVGEVIEMGEAIGLEGEGEGEHEAEDEIEKRIEKPVESIEVFEDPCNVGMQLKRFDEAMCYIQQFLLHYSVENVLEVDGRYALSVLVKTVTDSLLFKRIKNVYFAIPCAISDDPILNIENLKGLFPESGLNLLCKTNTVVSNLNWLRSDFNTNCPVKLYEGKLVIGRPELSVRFLGYIYLLSSSEDQTKFIENPYQYINSTPNCRLAIIGPKSVGKSTMAMVMHKLLNAHLIDARCRFRIIEASVRQTYYKEALENAIQKEVAKQEMDKFEDEKNDVRSNKWKANIREKILEMQKFDSKNKDEDYIANMKKNKKFLSELNIKYGENDPEIDFEDLLPPELKKKKRYYPPIDENSLQVKKSIEQFVDEKMKTHEISIDDYINSITDRMNQFDNEAFAETANFGRFIIDNIPMELNFWEMLANKRCLPDVVITFHDEKREKIKEIYSTKYPRQFCDKDYVCQKIHEIYSELFPSSSCGIIKQPEMFVKEMVMRIIDSIIPYDKTDEVDVLMEQFEECIVNQEEIIKFIESLGIIVLRVDIGKDNGTWSEVLTDAISQYLSLFKCKAYQLDSEECAMLKTNALKLYRDELQSKVIQPKPKKKKGKKKLKSNANDNVSEEETTPEGETEDSIEEEDNIPEPIIIQTPRDSISKAIAMKYYIQYGNTFNYCPMKFYENNILLLGDNNLVVNYNNFNYFLSSAENVEKFMLDPFKYSCSLKRRPAPKIRYCLIGPIGSRKKLICTNLAEKLNLKYCSFFKLMNSYIINNVKVSKDAEIVDTGEGMETADALNTTEGFETAERTGTAEGWDTTEGVDEADRIYSQRPKIIRYDNRNEMISELGNELILKEIIHPLYQDENFVLEGYPQTVNELDAMINNNMHPEMIILLKIDFKMIEDKAFKNIFNLYRMEMNSKMRNYYDAVDAIKAGWRAQRLIKINELIQLRIKENLEKCNCEDDDEREIEREVEAECNCEVEPECDCEVEGLQAECSCVDGEEELFMEAAEEVDKTFPLPKFPKNPTWSKREIEELKEMITDEVKEIYNHFVQNSKDLKDFAAEQRIPVTVVNIKNPQLNVTLSKISKLCLNSYFHSFLFDSVFKITNYDTVIRLIDEGQFLYSRFGKMCPMNMMEKKCVNSFEYKLSRNKLTHVLYRDKLLHVTKFRQYEKTPWLYMSDLNILLPVYPVRISITGPKKSGVTTVCNRIAKQYDLKVLNLHDIIEFIKKHLKWSTTYTNLKRLRKSKNVITDNQQLVCDCLFTQINFYVKRGYVMDNIIVNNNFINLNQFNPNLQRTYFHEPNLNIFILTDFLYIMKNLIHSYFHDIDGNSEDTSVDTQNPDEPPNTKIIKKFSIEYLFKKYYDKWLDYNTKINLIKSNFNDNSDNYNNFYYKNLHFLPITYRNYNNKWHLWYEIKLLLITQMKRLALYTKNLLAIDFNCCCCLNTLLIDVIELNYRLDKSFLYCPVCLIKMRKFLQFKYTMINIVNKDFYRNSLALTLYNTNVYYDNSVNGDGNGNGGYGDVGNVMAATNSTTLLYVSTKKRSKIIYNKDYQTFFSNLIQYRDKFYWVCDKHIFDINILSKQYLPIDITKLPKYYPYLVDSYDKEIVYGNGKCIVSYIDQLPDNHNIYGDENLAVFYKKMVYLCANEEKALKFLKDPENFLNINISRRSTESSVTCDWDWETMKIDFKHLTNDLLIKLLIEFVNKRPKHIYHNRIISSAIYFGLLLKIRNKLTTNEQKGIYEEIFINFNKECIVFEKHLNLFKNQSNPVPVPDARFDYLCEYHKPASKVPAFLNVVDIAGLVKGASQGQGLGNAFLSHISACDSIFHLTRAFEDTDVTHIEGEVNPVRDLEIIAEELRLKDEENLMKHIDKMEKVVNRGSDKKLKPEYDTLMKIKGVLVDEKKHLRFADWTVHDIEILNKYLFLTSKPVIYLVNLSEKDFIRKKNKWLLKIKEWIDQHDPGSSLIPFSGYFEQKLVEMETDEERKKYIEDTKCISALDKIIITGYKALQLEYFFTAGADEVKAWTVQRGTKAPQAAGRIHTDFEKGFIMAEVMHYVDFKEEGTEAACKGAGKYRQQGRNYTVEDGDIIFFKFNAGAGLKDPKKK